MDGSRLAIMWFVPQSEPTAGTVGAPGSLHGQALGADSASNGTVCVTSAEDKEPL